MQERSERVSNAADDRNQVELNRMMHAGTAFPVNVPTLLACIFERLPDAYEAAEPEIVVGLLAESRDGHGLIEHPLVGGTVIALWTSIDLRLEGFAERRWDVYNLQTDCASGIAGESSKVRSPGEVITDGDTAQGVLVIALAKSNG